MRPLGARTLVTSTWPELCREACGHAACMIVYWLSRLIAIRDDCFSACACVEAHEKGVNVRGPLETVM